VCASQIPYRLTVCLPHALPPLLPHGRAKREWHYRWGETFGLPSRPESSEADWRPHWTPPQHPELPVHGVRRNNLVEPTASARRWDAAAEVNVLPFQPLDVQSTTQSLRSFGGASRPSIGGGSRVSGSRASGKSLPPVAALSLSSSNDRRRDLLEERQRELQMQLLQVEGLLKNVAPTTQLSFRSEDWRPSTGGSDRARPITGGSSTSVASSRASSRHPHAAASLAPVAEVPPPVLATPREPRAPLCQDINAQVSPMVSAVGVSMLLPGAVLSASMGF
jgi:hypothetical protein